MRIEATGFGYIIIDGRRYDDDIVISGDLRVRSKEISSKLRAEFGHTPLTGEEIRTYFSEDPPDVIVVGSGQSGMMPLVGVEEACRELGTELIVRRTPEAIEIFNDLLSKGKKVGGIFHVTC